MPPRIQSSAENHGDPSGKLWSMYLTEAEKEDEQITKHWVEDTGGILVFNGLLSAIIATFLTISVPRLLPDYGLQTVVLLTQLVNASAGAPAVVQNSLPFHPPASIVRVNVMWFLSLILSLSCALLTTSIQQSAREYLDHSRHHNTPLKQARIRRYMFEGVEKFQLSRAVGTMSFLLHVSVFLFLAGLIEFLLPINTTVAIFALGFIVVCACIYAITSMLPILHPNCPYRTPLSGFTYFSFHLSASVFFAAVMTIESIFHGFLLEISWWSIRDLRTPRYDGPSKWGTMLKAKVHAHYNQFRHGLQWRIAFSATEEPSRVDSDAISLHWTLTTLEDEKFEEFAARMPGFFESSAVPHASSVMLSLMSEYPPSDPLLGSRLRELLGSCRPGASPLTEEQRNNRLRVCLTSLWYCIKAYNLPENSGKPLAQNVRAIFASPQVIDWIQNENNFALRLLGRCFASLIVKKLANDIKSPTRTSFSTIMSEIACISYILNATRDQVLKWRDQKGAIDLANVAFLALGEFETLPASVAVTEGDMVDVYQKTLHILIEGFPSSWANVDWDTNQVARFNEIYIKFMNAPLPEVLKRRLRYIAERLHLSPTNVSVAVPKMVMPLPPKKMGSEKTPSYPVPSSNSSEGPSRIGNVPDSGFSDGISSTPTRD
ncbi:hypothetical protein EI94DRAFT_1786065 [Lactarius quietus]|nr:hypothetical protein EI94DRAFT_1815253 [Lactarius quietus]KAF8268151.1 hypothetical protein EI94DRAFT_1786065 [Lactarius quietus]